MGLAVTNIYIYKTDIYIYNIECIVYRYYYELVYPIGCNKFPYWLFPIPYRFQYIPYWLFPIPCCPWPMAHGLLPVCVFSPRSTWVSEARAKVDGAAPGRPQCRAGARLSKNTHFNRKASYYMGKFFIIDLNKLFI